jgi:hypothetical protein
LSGLLLDGMLQPIMWLLVAIELLAAALAWWAIRAAHGIPPGPAPS